MKRPFGFGSLVLALAFGVSPAQAADVRNIGHGDGYSVSFIRAEPAPGTKLMEGATVHLSLSVRYTLAKADTGKIVLVFADEAFRPLFPGSKQPAVEVKRGSGEVNFEQDFQVPKGTRRIKLSIPIVPTGLTRTSGEILLEYGVRRK